jgi:hypothetical protein
MSGVSGMDGAEASLAGQGKGAERRAPTDLDSATLVVDPLLPADMRYALACASGKLVPYSGPVPDPESPRNGASGCLVIAGIFFFVATLGFVNGATGGGYTMLAVGGIATLFALLARPGARDVAAARAPVTQHRRYVLPATDIDAGHWQLWKRAVDARNRIVRAEVVSAGQIDSVQVAEVLPQRLWEIAERLARLSEVRARHQEILGSIAPDDPDVAPAVSRQRRAQEIAAADVARRVGNLEIFADLVERADNATRKESVLRELHALDDKHAELIAGVGDTAADADLTRRLADDVTAVIEQAREAIRDANDAARSLAALPDDEPADGPAGDADVADESLSASLGNPRVGRGVLAKGTSGACGGEKSVVDMPPMKRWHEGPAVSQYGSCYWR